MKATQVAGLVGLIAVRVVMDIPRTIANAAGFGFKKSFVIGTKTVARPERFASKDQKAAFERVGNYVTDALTRDVMLSFMDADLTKKDNFWGTDKVALAAWHEALEFFEAEGCIFRRWDLGIPSYGEYLYTPSWLADGSPIPEKGKASAISGLIPDSRPFEPSLLTDEQKAELVGKPYALHPSHSVGPETWNKQEQAYVTLEEKHFRRVFVRRREVLTEEAKQKGAETLVEVFKASARE